MKSPTCVNGARNTRNRSKSPGDQRADKIAEWQNALNAADNELNADIQKILDKRFEAYEKMLKQEGMSNFEKKLADTRADAAKEKAEMRQAILSELKTVDPAKDQDRYFELLGKLDTLDKMEEHRVKQVQDEGKVDPELR